MWLPLVLIAAFFWALSNSLDSLLVRCYVKKPSVLMWYGSWVSFIAASLLWVFWAVDTQWFGFLAILAVTQYAADFGYYRVLDRIDMSLINAAWALTTIFLSVGGFVFFGESWTLLQAMGVALVLGAIGLLSFWHHALPTGELLFYLVGIAVSYVPYWLGQKYALSQGASPHTLMAIGLLCHATLGLLCPLTLRRARQQIKQAWSQIDARFWWATILITFGWFTATFLTMMAYKLGPISLVSVAFNVQPFFAILLAWLLLKYVPRYAPREVLTAQSLQVKCVCFVIIFVGLALLTL